MTKNWRLDGPYDPHKVEETVTSFWDKEKIYEMVKDKSKRGREIFKFVDGPPYPSSDVPHLGTAWNKSLKDAVLRYMRMKGFNVIDTPGYDCHGLPIEVKVEQLLGVKSKREIETKVGIERFIEECKRFAKSNIAALTKWFKELGVFMDWDNPYLTLNDEYIEAEWWLIRKADEKGLLDKDYRVVYWCPRCSTTLAEYEVEYKEIEDPSIYVKFPVTGEDSVYLVIWTTTPWTLPANAFIMAHPDETYVKVRVGSEHWIIAEKRLEDVMREIGTSNYEIVERLRGSDLSKYRYAHPLEDIIPLQRVLKDFHVVVMSPEYVVMHEGTGLVHGAPAHGFEDYEVAVKHGLQGAVLCPVDDEGKFTEDAGPFAHMHVKEANPHIIKALRERRALLYEGKIVHKYPVCWRCKTPVILRATRQWIIRVTKLKDRIKEEAEGVTWIPSWALSRLENIVDNLQDWVLSRQRYWGAPLPIWECPNGHRVVVGSLDELIKLSGTRPKELHRPWIDQVKFRCPKCGQEMRRVPDVVDVWLDSGVAFYASRGHPNRMRPDEIVLDFITEGHDQIRGWFFSLLRAGVIGFDTAPYRVVLVHGFMLDEQGREMHKSLGNYVGLDEAISRVGRDPLRLWLLGNTVWEDVKFSWRELDESRRDLSILWNVALFTKMYMEVDGYNPVEHRLEEYIHVLRAEDRWLLSRLNSLIESVRRNMDGYNVAEAVRLIRAFIVEDLSHLYIRLARPRVWVDENTPDKMACYTVLYHALDRLVRVLAPITPFISEYIYQALFRNYHKLPSVHLLDYPEPDSRFIDKELEELMEVAREVYKAAASARMRAGLKLRQPVRELIVYTDNAKVKNAVETLEGILRFMCNAKSVRVLEAKSVRDITRYRVRPVYRVLGPRYREAVKLIAEYIDSNSDKVAADIVEKGVHRAIVGGTAVELTITDVEITPYYVEGYLVEDFKYGAVALDTRLTPEEVAEGLARDIVRRVQVMRKKMNLPITAKIKTYIVAPMDRTKLLELKREYIMSETRSVELVITDRRELAENLEGYIEEWEIDDENYVIAVKPVE